MIFCLGDIFVVFLDNRRFFVYENEERVVFFSLECKGGGGIWGFGIRILGLFI